MAGLTASSEITFDIHAGVLTVTFNRPASGNAMTGLMAKILCDKLKDVAEDRGVRLVYMRGQGDQFMNGQDMRGYMGDSNSLQDANHQKVHFFYTAIRELQAMEKPVLSAVRGRVAGAGFNLMLASDLVIAARGTVFNPGFTAQSMVPDAGGSFFLPRKVGAARANEILLLNEDFSAETAEKWGLINRVVDDAAFEDETAILIEKLASGATRAMGATKRLIGTAFEQNLNGQLSLEAVHSNTVLKSFDFREAMKALATNAPPKFTGA